MKKRFLTILITCFLLIFVLSFFVSAEEGYKFTFNDNIDLGSTYDSKTLALQFRSDYIAEEINSDSTYMGIGFYNNMDSDGIMIDFTYLNSLGAEVYVTVWENGSWIYPSAKVIYFDTMPTGQYYDYLITLGSFESSEPDVPVDPSPDPIFNPYQTCYDLLNTYIFGGTVVEGTYKDLVCIQVSTLVCLFLFLLPFLVVFWVIRRVC